MTLKLPLMNVWFPVLRQGSWAARERGPFGRRSALVPTELEARALSELLNTVFWEAWAVGCVTTRREPANRTAAIHLVLEVLDVTDTSTAEILATLINDRTTPTAPEGSSLPAAICAVGELDEGKWTCLLGAAIAIADA